MWFKCHLLSHYGLPKHSAIDCVLSVSKVVPCNEPKYWGGWIDGL